MTHMLMQKLLSLCIKERFISNQKMMTKTTSLSLTEYVLFKHLDILKKENNITSYALKFKLF